MKVVLEGCHAVILTTDESDPRLLLVNERHGKTFYNTPGGKRELGETTEGCLSRELGEELEMVVGEQWLRELPTYVTASKVPNGVIQSRLKYFCVDRAQLENGIGIDVNYMLIDCDMLVQMTMNHVVPFYVLRHILTCIPRNHVFFRRCCVPVDQLFYASVRIPVDYYHLNPNAVRQLQRRALFNVVDKPAFWTVLLVDEFDVVGGPLIEGGDFRRDLSAVMKWWLEADSASRSAHASVCLSGLDQEPLLTDRRVGNQ
jgi:8-oxo-dGTP pyrophosphatase MutT (NUDIX family)